MLLVAAVLGLSGTTIWRAGLDIQGNRCSQRHYSRISWARCVVEDIDALLLDGGIGDRTLLTPLLDAIAFDRGRSPLYI